jgi:hypothetical protein
MNEEHLKKLLAFAFMRGCKWSGVTVHKAEELGKAAHPDLRPGFIVFAAIEVYREVTL